MSDTNPAVVSRAVGTPRPPTAHHCRRRHRRYQTLAECCWPDAAWVVGDGPYAVLAHCDMLSVTLHDTAAAARATLRRLEDLRCCRACVGRHEILVLTLPEPRGAAGRGQPGRGPT